MNVSSSGPSTRQYAFLLYDSRSGSTLFASMLNRFRGVAVAHESSFISRVIEYQGSTEVVTNMEHLTEYLFEEVQFRELGFPREVVREALSKVPFPHYKSHVVDMLLACYFDRLAPDSKVGVVKDAAYSHLSTLRQWLPAVRFIHVVRDGRAVFYSKIRSQSISGRQMERNVIKAALDWRRKCRMAHGADVLTIRYEDLLERPDTTLERVLDFLHIDAVDREVTKTQEDYHQVIGHAQMHLHSNVGMPPIADFAVKWQTALRPSDIALYEWIAGSCLRLHQYTVAGRETSKPSPASLVVTGCKGISEYVFDRLSNIIRAAFVTRDFRVRLRRKLSRWKHR